MGRLTDGAGAPDDGIWRRPAVVDVSSAVGRPPGSARMRGWVCGPAEVRTRRPLLIYCVAGGGCSTGYFDLRVGDDATYSMADHFARAGAIVAALDHLGAGESDPVADIFAVEPLLLARCHHLGAQQVLSDLHNTLRPDGSHAEPVITIGLGHSMGGLIAAVTQSRHGSFDALVTLGTGGGLREVLTDDERALTGTDLEDARAELVRLARLRFEPGSGVPRKKPERGTFFAPDVPDPVRRAFAERAVPLLPACGLASMVPGLARADRAAVAVPLFLGFGQADLTADHLGVLAEYAAVNDATLFVLAGSGHCHNQAANRRVLWDRILAWGRSLERSGAGT